MKKRAALLFVSLTIAASAQVVMTVPLQPGTTLSNVRYEWIANGTSGSAQSSGITQPDSTYPMFRISATPPSGAEEMIVYDNSDTTNWNTGGYRLSFLDAAVSTRGTSTLTQAQVTGGAYALNTDGSGNVKVSSGTGANQISLISGTVTFANTSIGTVTTLTNLPSIPAGWLTASGIASGALNGKGDWSTYAGGDTAGVTTLLSRLTSVRAGYLDNISVAPPTVAQMLDTALAGHNTPGTWGAAVTAAGNASDPWSVVLPGSYTGHQAGKIFAQLDIPTATGFVATIPSAPTSASMCRVYGYLADLNFQPAVNVTVTFRLATLPAKGTKIITGPNITAKTDSQGRINDAAGNAYIDLQRNDAITPSGSSYLVSCAQAGIQNKPITLTATTFDLSTAIP